MDTKQLLDLVGEAINAETNRMCAEAGQITLGELAARLEAANQDAPIKFDDGNSPGSMHSYRGYYQYVSVGTGPDCLVKDFLSEVTTAIGRTFSGYKGGDYKMTRMTPVWASEWGESSGIGIVDVDTSGDTVVLKTAKIEHD